MNYKDNILSLGFSDIARLIISSPKGVQELKFGSDGTYNAYIVSSDMVIPNHYSHIMSCEGWMKVYDDEGLTWEKYADKIDIFRAGDFGCILKVQ